MWEWSTWGVCIFPPVCFQTSLPLAALSGVEGEGGPISWPEETFLLLVSWSSPVYKATLSMGVPPGDPRDTQCQQQATLTERKDTAVGKCNNIVVTIINGILSSFIVWPNPPQKTKVVAFNRIMKYEQYGNKFNACVKSYNIADIWSFLDQQ